jgi:hypothetical protein
MKIKTKHHSNAKRNECADETIKNQPNANKNESKSTTNRKGYENNKKA